MVFDYHVHVTGRPIDSLIDEAAAKLRDSLRVNEINGFIGIISSGTFYYDNMSIIDAFNTDFNILFDNNYHGLKIVKDLGGEPAILIYPISCGTNLNFTLSKCKENNIKILKLYTNDNTNITSLINQAPDYGITTLLFHTPTNISLIKPFFPVASHNSLQVILGHGCYDNPKLMSLVSDYGFFVDTSINPIETINKWVNAGLEKNLVFGSDWPCSLEGSELDWNAQKREKEKIKELVKIINKNRVSFN